MKRHHLPLLLTPLVATAALAAPRTLDVPARGTGIPGVLRVGGPSLREFEAVTSLAFSPSGKRLAAAGSRQVTPSSQPGPALALYGTETGLPQWSSTDAGEGTILGLVFRGEHSLVSIHSDGPRIWDLSKLPPRARRLPSLPDGMAKDPRSRVVGPVVDGTGARLAVGEEAGAIGVWNLEEGTLERVLPAQGGELAALAFDPAEPRLWIARAGQSLARLDLTREGSTPEQSGGPILPGNPYYIALSEDAGVLAHRTLERIHIVDPLSGTELATIQQGTSPSFLRLLARGRFLYASDVGSADLYDLLEGGAPLRLQPSVAGPIAASEASGLWAYAEDGIPMAHLAPLGEGSWRDTVNGFSSAELGAFGERLYTLSQAGRFPYAAHNYHQWNLTGFSRKERRDALIGRPSFSAPVSGSAGSVDLTALPGATGVVFTSSFSWSTRPQVTFQTRNLLGQVLLVPGGEHLEPRTKAGAMRILGLSPSGEYILLGVQDSQAQIEVWTRGGERQLARVGAATSIFSAAWHPLRDEVLISLRNGQVARVEIAAEDATDPRPLFKAPEPLRRLVPNPSGKWLLATDRTSTWRLPLDERKKPEKIGPAVRNAAFSRNGQWLLRVSESRELSLSGCHGLDEDLRLRFPADVFELATAARADRVVVTIGRPEGRPYPEPYSFDFPRNPASAAYVLDLRRLVGDDCSEPRGWLDY